MPQGEGEVLGVFTPIDLNGVWSVFLKWKFIRLVHEKFTIFLYIIILLETSVCWISEGVVSFEIKVGVYEKFAKMYQ